MSEWKARFGAAPIRSKAMNSSFTGNESSRRKREHPSWSSSGSTCHRLGAVKESCPTGSVSPQPTESSSTVSRISLDNDRASMENNASSRGRHSMSSDLDSSMPSTLGESLRGSGDRPGSEDSWDNFPYAPPNRKPIPRHIVAPRWSIKPK